VSELSGRSGYSIAAVSRLTGVSCHALRVWERRYGFPRPRRSASGHRRYGAEQVEILRQIAARLKAGHAIGDVIHDLRESGPGTGFDPAEEASDPAPEWSRILDRLGTGDLDGAEREYARQVDGLAPREQVERVIEPALIETGERWFRSEFDVAQERCSSGFLRLKLGQMIQEARWANARPAGMALVGTVQGDRHEGGVLMVSLLLELSGWRALPMGVDLPVAEYQRAIDRFRPGLVGVSFVLSRNINKRFAELARLRGAPIFVGGRSIVNYRGLARRYKLAPVTGPVGVAVERMLAVAGGSSPDDDSD
jgi:DNA-binding transcriptional MerR regulator